MIIDEYRMHFDVLRRCHYVIQEKSNIDCSLPTFLAMQSLETVKNVFKSCLLGIDAGMLLGLECSRLFEGPSVWE